MISEIAQPVLYKGQTIAEAIAAADEQGSSSELFEFLSALEWIETNGLGGWASSTLSGARTRRYHGLLISAGGTPFRRRALLTSLDERVQIATQSFELSCHRYQNVIEPQGYLLLREASKGLFPLMRYGKEGLFSIEKSILAIAGQNSVVLKYELLDAVEPLRLSFAPYLTDRGYHELGANLDRLQQIELKFEGDTTRFNYPGAETLFSLRAEQLQFVSEPHIFRDFYYRIEDERGEDCLEDMFTPGRFECSLNKGDSLLILISSEKQLSDSPANLFQREIERRTNILKKVEGQGEDIARLALAADQFIINRPDKKKSVIAGYHWFTDWGRDTMISLEGLTLATGRFSDARAILETYVQYLDQGMIPNRFPDESEAPEYNTVDATLWMAVAAKKYVDATDDLEFMREVLLPALESVVRWHQQGTRFEIRLDSDALLSAGSGIDQLTWMDARVGKTVFTPRHGKPVEINALWYNCLRTLAEWCERCDLKEQAQNYFRLAEDNLQSFQSNFWIHELGYFADVVADSGVDSSLRPNQIFALSLPFELCTREQAQSVISVFQRELLTPYGLRSLASADLAYSAQYKGVRFERDKAYHQGTVWAWLIGAYVEAVLRFGSEDQRNSLEPI